MTTPERANRKGDTQPLPIEVNASEPIDPVFVTFLGQIARLHNIDSSVAAAVGADIGRRTDVGIQRYGMPLKTWNGRDAGLDAYEEAMDLAKYCTQLHMEHPSSDLYRRLMYQACDILFTLAKIRYER